MLDKTITYFSNQGIRMNDASLIAQALSMSIGDEMASKRGVDYPQFENFGALESMGAILG